MFNLKNLIKKSNVRLEVKMETAIAKPALIEAVRKLVEQADPPGLKKIVRSLQEQVILHTPFHSNHHHHTRLAHPVVCFFLFFLTTIILLRFLHTR